jgi:hypothetical protein
MPFKLRPEDTTSVNIDEAFDRKAIKSLGIRLDKIGFIRLDREVRRQIQIIINIPNGFFINYSILVQ